MAIAALLLGSTIGFFAAVISFALGSSFATAFLLYMSVTFVVMSFTMLVAFFAPDPMPLEPEPAN